MRMLLLVVALALTACQSTPKTEVVEVKVKVKEPCISEAPVRPTYETGDGPYPGDKEAASALARDFEKADQYATDWETASVGCLLPEPSRQ